MQTDSPASRAAQPPTFGIVAIGFAVAQLLPVVAAAALARTGWRSQGFEEAVGRFVFDYGLALDLMACALAILAVARGGRNRRFGFIALAVVALSLALLFVG